MKLASSRWWQISKISSRRLAEYYYFVGIESQEDLPEKKRKLRGSGTDMNAGPCCKIALCLNWIILLVLSLLTPKPRSKDYLSCTPGSPRNPSSTKLHSRVYRGGTKLILGSSRSDRTAGGFPFFELWQLHRIEKRFTRFISPKQRSQV